jgi:hypothetical protein
MSDGSKPRNRSSAWTPAEMGEINGMITKAITEVSEGKSPVVLLTELQFKVLQETVTKAVGEAVHRHLAALYDSKQHTN